MAPALCGKEHVAWPFQGANSGAMPRGPQTFSLSTQPRGASGGVEHLTIFCNSRTKTHK